MDNKEMRTNHVGETLMGTTVPNKRERVRKLRAHIAQLKMQYAKQIALLEQLANAIEEKK